MPGNPFYRSQAWRKARAAFLATHPICSVPGCDARATDVDHVQTIRSGGDALDPAGFRAYCHQHHSQKTARRDRGAYRRSDKPVVAHGCTADGVPLDPGHPWRKGAGGSNL